MLEAKHNYSEIPTGGNKTRNESFEEFDPLQLHSSPSKMHQKYRSLLCPSYCLFKSSFVLITISHAPYKFILPKSAVSVVGTD